MIAVHYLALHGIGFRIGKVGLSYDGTVKLGTFNLSSPGSF